MKKFVTVSIFISTIVLVSGCATVIRGSSEDISINSQPSGAAVRLSTGQTCNTPCTLDVARKGDVTANFSKEGYESFETAIPSSIDGGALAGFTFLNLLFIPIINDIVDYNARANYSRKPNPVGVTLVESKE